MKLTPLFLAATALALTGAGCVNIRTSVGPQNSTPTAPPAVTTAPVKAEEPEKKNETTTKTETAGTAAVTTQLEVTTPKTEEKTEEKVSAEAAAPVTVTVTITDAGFSPNDVTVKLNGTVTFVNTANTTHWPASAPHPVHTNLPGFDSQGIDPGQSWTYQFTKVGNWGYHDHVAPSHFGIVKVKE